MKIIEAISDGNIGGAGILLLNRLSARPEYKKNTVVLIPKSSQLTEMLKKNEIKVVELPLNKNRSFDFEDLAKIYFFLKKHPTDIINTHGFLSARLAAFLCNVPVKICTRHCVFETPKKYKIYPIKKVIGTLNSLLSDRFIAVAHSARENLLELGIKKEKISVIINGSKKLKELSSREKLNIRKKYHINKNDFVVGIFARLEKYKGHDTLIRAAEIITKNNKNFVFLVVGEGSEKNKLYTMVKRHGVSDKFIFTGYVKDITELMNITDINVNCSRGTETSSLALSEGMSIGKPCIASDWGGNPYMVNNKVNGLLFKTDNYRELSKCILTLYKNKKLYSRLSDGAYERYLSELNIEASSKKTDRLSESLYVKKLKLQNRGRDSKINY